MRRLVVALCACSLLLSCLRGRIIRMRSFQFSTDGLSPLSCRARVKQKKDRRPSGVATRRRRDGRPPCGARLHPAPEALPLAKNPHKYLTRVRRLETQSPSKPDHSSTRPPARAATPPSACFQTLPRPARPCACPFSTPASPRARVE